jgi:flagellar hook-associated protein 1
MLSLFGTLNMASRSLQTQMTGVEVSGQNLANVNTTGYTRQTVDIQTSPDIGTAIGSEGTGANAVAIQQAVNLLLNSQIQTQQSANGYWSGQQSALQYAQTNLNEFLNGTGSTSSTSGNTTTDTGLSGQLTGLFNAFQALATSPTSIPVRQALINQAQTVASSFKQIDSQLADTNASLNTSITNNVNSANTLLSGIAQLNGQISSAEFNGGTPNDLLDEREQDLENLSQLTNIQTSTGTNGAVDISIGGQTLVSNNQVLDTMGTYSDGNGNLLVQTATGGVPLSLSGGSIQGTIDARDGELSSLRSNLNILASTLISQVDLASNNGYNLNGTSGNSFFLGSGSSTIEVNPAILNDPTLIQASGSATATGDNSIASAVADLASTPQSELNNQTFGDSYTETVTNLGSSLQDANNQVTNQNAVTNMLSTQRSSTSGVNIDEEMTNMMGFERAYQASAQLVTTVDQMLQSVIGMST